MDDNSQNIPLPILSALAKHVLPSWERWGTERCLVAPTDLNERNLLERWLETGARISPCPYRGPRVAVKGPRDNANRSAIVARWPKDDLWARRNPIMVFVINGQTDFRIGDQLLHCSAGHSILLLPGTPQPRSAKSHLEGEGSCELLWLSIGDESGIGCWICHSENERHFELPGESCYILDSHCVALFKAFIYECTEQKRENRQISNHIMLALLAALCREIEDNRIFQFNYQRVQASQETPPRQFIDPISASRQYVEDHLHLPLRIDDLTHRFLLSRSEFTQRFKQETGQTFKEYLIAARMAEARRLLSETTWSIQKIAQTIGITTSRLRDLFHQTYNVSPKDFRKGIQNPDAIAPLPDATPEKLTGTGD